MAKNRTPRFPAFLLFSALLASGCMRHMHKPSQGIYGTFRTYGPPREQVDCTPFRTQMEKDDCRRMNQRVIEEPHRAVIRIRNLQTREVLSVPLDSAGAYRAVVDPGEYEVCVEGECSDPITVRMNAFVPYGQRLPRPTPEAEKAQADSLEKK